MAIATMGNMVSTILVFIDRIVYWFIFQKLLHRSVF